MSRVVALCVALFACISSASAQIIYEPVQSQYDVEGTKYYYGGRNPVVHDYAAEVNNASRTSGRAHGLAFGSGDMLSHREVSNEPLRAFNDGFRSGLINGHLVGYTDNDARNDAYANQARYFVKRDLLASAVRQADGSWHVPAFAPTVKVYKSSGQRIEQVAPASMPRPLMIIPKDKLKDQLIRPIPQSDKTLTRAD